MQRLVDSLGRLQALGPDAAWRHVVEADVDFHESLVAAAASPRLLRLFHGLANETRLVIALQRELYESIDDLVNEHDASSTPSGASASIRAGACCRDHFEHSVAALATTVEHRQEISSTSLDSYRALSFDCYGTLIDWETGIVQALQPWGASRGVDRSPTTMLELFGEHEAASKRSTRRCGTPTCSPKHCGGRRLARPRSGRRRVRRIRGQRRGLAAFADTATSLRRLQERFRLIIVSNVDRAPRSHAATVDSVWSSTW